MAAASSAAAQPGVAPAGNGRSEWTPDDEAEPVPDWEGLAPPPREGSDGWEHVYENGRRYHLFQQGRYPLPNDDQEQNREDMKHAIMLELTEGRLHYAPLRDDIEKIMDIGTGTGIWAIEIGDEYPNAQVLGIDLSPMQPDFMPPNVNFLLDDCEDEWANGPDWDYIHLRHMATILREVDKVIQEAFHNLRPGGWIELQDLWPLPRCDDGTMPPDDPLLRFYEQAGDAFEFSGMDLHKVRALRGPLTRAGFTNIHLVKKKAPIGTWMEDETLKRLGEYQRVTCLEVIGSLAGKPFEAMGISRLEREVWAATARKAVDDLSVHRYFTIYFWIAQKPE